MTTRKCVVLLLALGVFGSRAAAAPPPLVITTTVNFSALDGGPNDLDGMEDGNLVTAGLIVRSVGTIIIDVPLARFTVFGDVVMQNIGAIRTPSVPIQDPGPFIDFNILSMGSLLMRGDSLIRSHGLTTGGFIRVNVTEGDIILSQRARVEAHSTVADGTGGLIVLNTAQGLIQLINTTNRVTANGMHGGLVNLNAAFSTACPSVSINGTVNAVGFNGDGGSVFITAFQGGLAVLDGQFRIAAIGTTSPGQVFLTAERSLTPNPPQTQPPATIQHNNAPCP